MKEGIFEFLLAFVIFGICLGVPAWVGAQVEEGRRKEKILLEKSGLEEELKVLSERVDGKTVRPLLRILELENEINRLEMEVRR